MTPNLIMPDADSYFSREKAAGYNRQIIERTRVVVAGAGALGQWIMLCLALIGYPLVTCVDFDRFDESNATRSPFYGRGRFKAPCVAAGARRMCTARAGVCFRYFVGMVQQLGDILFREAQPVVVFSALDSQPGRLWLADRCRKASVPLVEGGFHGEHWNVSVFANSCDDAPCWACGQTDIEPRRVFSCEAYAREAESDGFIPATAPGAMALAACMVSLATQLLHGNDSLADCTLVTDLNRGKVQLMRRSCDSSCRLDHRVLARKAVQLTCNSRATVAELLRELEHVSDDAIVHLPASFIRVAPCVRCHESCLVNKPEWAIHQSPRCRACGGRFERSSDLPEQHGVLSQEASANLLEVSLADVGLGPGLLLCISGRDAPHTVALAGTSCGMLDAADLDSNNEHIPEGLSTFVDAPVS